MILLRKTNSYGINYAWIEISDRLEFQPDQQYIIYLIEVSFPFVKMFLNGFVLIFNKFGENIPN